MRHKRIKFSFCPTTYMAGIAYDRDETWHMIIIAIPFFAMVVKWRRG